MCVEILYLRPVPNPRTGSGSNARSACGICRHLCSSSVPNELHTLLTEGQVHRNFISIMLIASHMLPWLSCRLTCLSNGITPDKISYANRAARTAKAPMTTDEQNVCQTGLNQACLHEGVHLQALQAHRTCSKPWFRGQSVQPVAPTQALQTIGRKAAAELSFKLHIGFLNALAVTDAYIQHQAYADQVRE